MLVIAYIAFLGDLVAAILNQIGFVLQKLAHRDQEQLQQRKVKKENQKQFDQHDDEFKAPDLQQQASIEI